ncbi:MAG: tRNA epoxyqueuosine(34) reductase QueG [Phycisphaerae bacterium]|nr:tRNA epoxyqueuosine(34) reductase QueG [Phycisphaerae bacterium]
MQFDDTLTTQVKALATQCGFARVGIAPVVPVASAEPIEHGEHMEKFRQWLANGFHAGMAFMADNVDKRLHPDKLVEGASCVICLAISYMRNDDEPYESPGAAYIARYARGRDYHKLLKKRAVKLCDRIREIFPGFVGRCFVDTAPLPERTLAVQSGLGWIGRNGMLIVPGLGNHVHLAEIVCNLPLQPDTAKPRPDGCGDCTACIAACPTGAILPDKTIDCNRCISYHTIENRGEIPREVQDKIGNRVFGCDACQSICPHTRNAPPGDEQLTAAPENSALPLTIEQIRNWTYDDWDLTTRGSALRRATHEMFIRNGRSTTGK